MILPIELSELMNLRFISLGFRKCKSLSEHYNAIVLIFCIVQMLLGLFMVIKHMVSLK